MVNRLSLAFVFLFFIIKFFAIYFTSFNLFGDEAQYWLWSKDLDFGYFSKPPFLSWFIGLYTIFFGDSFVSLKILPSVVYLCIGFAFFNLSKSMGLKKDEAVSCTLLFLIMPAVSFSSFILSTDLFLLFFWIMSMGILYQIIKSPSFVGFVLLGIVLGLAFLSKYAAVYFIVCLFLYFLIDQGFRDLILKNLLGVIIFFISFLIVIAPNIYWNINNNWITFQHTSDNANLNNISINIYRGIEFLFIQTLMIGPIVFFGMVFNYKQLKINKENKFLLTFSIPIMLIVVIEAVIVRANANWAATALVSLFLFCYLNLKEKRGLVYISSYITNLVFGILLFALIGLSYPAKIFDRISGIGVFAQEIYSMSKNLNVNNLVVSDRLLFSSLSYELREKNIAFHMPHKKGEKVSNHFKISSNLSGEMDKDFLLIGYLEDIEYLNNNYSIKKSQSFNTSFSKQPFNIYEVIFD